MQKPLISTNDRQTKYLRVNSQVFGVILLIICYFLLVVHSVALDAQLSAEDKLLPYPYLSSLNFKNLNSFDWLHFKISNPTPKLRSTTEAKLPLFVVKTHSDAVEGRSSSSSPSKTKELALCQIKFPEKST